VTSDVATVPAPWEGTLPTGWERLPLFALATEPKRKNVGLRETEVLSLSYGRIVVRDVDSNLGLLPASFETYQIVEPNEIVLRLTDLQNDKRSLRVGRCTQRGIITSAYVALRTRTRLDGPYGYYLLHCYDLHKVFYGLGGGVRQSMKYEVAALGAASPRAASHRQLPRPQNGGHRRPD
jgi:type I restriction enzyme S subunit